MRTPLGMTLAGKFEEAVNKAAAVTYAPSEGAGAALPFLREVARAMSGVDEKFDQMVRKALDEWAPELRHLVDTQELLTASRWYEFGRSY